MLIASIACLVFTIGCLFGCWRYARKAEAAARRALAAADVARMAVAEARMALAELNRIKVAARSAPAWPGDW